MGTHGRVSVHRVALAARGKDAAEAMRDENHFAMLPDVVLLKTRPKHVGQLHTGHPAI